MELFTTFQIPPIDKEHQIDYQSKTMTIGSCFAKSLSQKMEFYKFRSQANPFGVMFHPMAIENLLRRAFKFELFEEKDIFFHEDLWHSYEVHSECSMNDKELMLSTLNQKLREFRDAIASATHIVITLGTAWAYRHLQSDVLVANCHKIPQQEFQKEILSVVDVFDSLHRMRNFIRSINAYVRIIFTISPVRHLKDGFVENQRSKSLLFTALHEYLQDAKDDLQFYFPAYEVLMDELRDYRFYAEDLVHPSLQAIDFIWEKFKNAYIRESSYELMNEVSSIQTGLAHRPFNPDTEGHKIFLENLNERMKSLQDKVSFIKF
ncbi:GSCFA domain-containing protein [Capnocytophaga catalasegens]|uniref:GSCFA domain-containing protein n=1 Tax=Capnocytophaga catalasegens TaxID=1004260 RepID=A0AAV5B0C9_9FLAO|nr:GSCFA domain-containing protein [Capnocytophaga catalasegens]GIZ16553.1 hypothetical protein RCZ03_25530 [Capnocytophaga catalasegens]GJM51385.1 hypothetical protein RCZ15_23580 [Capnocytophaga catalasegens]GJM54289.1 hypothetical protein RCZ16_26050 [Capnocytophaga catalasegens]